MDPERVILEMLNNHEVHVLTNQKRSLTDEPGHRPKEWTLAHGCPTGAPLARLGSIFNPGQADQV